MERRRQPRIAVDLQAVLVNDRILPIGCRVGNVSITGMMLSHGGYDKKTLISEDDAVEVRISLKQDDDRKIIQFPLTITREEPYRFGCQFPEPRPDIIDLVAPYLVSDNDSEGFAHLDNREQLDAPDDISGTGNADSDGKATTTTKSWISASALLLFAGIFTASYLQSQFEQLDRQVTALDSQLKAIKVLSKTTAPEELPTDRELRQIKSRLEAIPNQIDSLDHRIFMLEFAAKIPQPSVDPKDLAEAGSNGSGHWTINLLSLNNESAAVDFTAKTQTKGIPAKIKVEMTADSTVWRVQVPGFTSREDAAAYSDRVVENLGLNTVWIFEE